MTPRTSARPLAVTPGNGASPASTRELVQTQNAILKSNDSVLGAVNQFREDLTDRIGRIATQVDGVCTQVDTIKTERRVEAALAVERTRNAEKIAKDAAAAETRHANLAQEERHDQTAKVESNILSRHWRITLLAGIATSIGISLLNFAMNR